MRKAVPLLSLTLLLLPLSFPVPAGEAATAVAEGPAAASNSPASAALRKILAKSALGFA